MRFCLCVVGKSFKSGGSKPWVGEGDGAMEMGCIEEEIGPIKNERNKITEKSDDLAKLSISVESFTV